MAPVIGFKRRNLLITKFPRDMGALPNWPEWVVVVVDFTLAKKIIKH